MTWLYKDLSERKVCTKEVPVAIVESCSGGKFKILVVHPHSVALFEWSCFSVKHDLTHGAQIE